MITYLVMAELSNGTPVLFGVDIDAKDWDEGIPKLWEYMNQNENRFIEARDLQAMMKVRYFKCPRCGDIMSPQGACANRDCAFVMSPQALREAASKGVMEGIIRVEMTSKAFQDGTHNTHHIRPQHIVLADVIPPDSPAYKHWKSEAERVRNEVRQIRSGIAPASGGEVLQFGKPK